MADKFSDAPQPDEHKEKAEMLRSLLSDPYCKGIAKRMLKRTQSMAGLGRKKLKKLAPPGVKTTVKITSDTNPTMPNTETGENLEKSGPALKTPPGTPQVVVNVQSPGDLERAVRKIEKGGQPSANTQKRIISVENTQQSGPTRRIFVHLESGQDLDKLAEQVEKTRVTPPGTRRVVLSIQDAQSLEEGIEELEGLSPSETVARARHTPVGLFRKIVIRADTPDDVDAATEEIEELPDEATAEVPEESAPGVQDESWIIDQISRGITDAPKSVADALIGNLQKKSQTQKIKNAHTPAQQPSANETSPDVERLAAEIDVNPADLYQAMQDEGLSSIADLYASFESMKFAETPLGKPDFRVFAKCLVDSYLDRRNEQQLLGLIGVSADTGKQNLSTTYALLFAEIFRTEIGGFFLQNTENLNYNAFNIANLIQEHLVELDEMTRVSYLENLLTLLYSREQLMLKSKIIIDRTIRDKYFVKIFPDPEYLFGQLEKYLADIAMFCLGKLPHDQLPEDISDLLPQDIYRCLKYVWGFPKNLVEKNSKVIYMLKQLADNKPMVFNLENTSIPY